jgi:hypothetical protein
MRKHLGDVIWRTDTQYTEFVLGILSLLTGIWLCLPISQPNFIASTVPIPHQVWGFMLTVTGVFKFLGVLYPAIGLRIFSSFLATFVWYFLTFTFYGIARKAGYCPATEPLMPITVILGSCNALIYIKLKVVSKACGTPI